MTKGRALAVFVVALLLVWAGSITGQAPSTLPSAPIIRMVFEGDSLTAQAQSYPNQLAARGGMFASAAKYNMSLSGQTCLQMTTQYTAQIHPYRPIGTDRGYYFLWCGINDIDLSSTAAATIYGYLQTMWAAARADGYTVVAFTMTPVTVGSGTWTAPKETIRLALNVLILSDPTLYDYVIRGEVALPDASNATYYADGEHPTAAGATVLTKVIAATLPGQPADIWWNLPTTAYSAVASTLRRVIAPASGLVDIGIPGGSSAVLTVNGTETVAGNITTTNNGNITAGGNGGIIGGAGGVTTPFNNFFCFGSTRACTKSTADGAEQVVTHTGATAGTNFTSAAYSTDTNCSSAASPAVCSAASAGSVVVAAAATTVTVNTTAVTANSQIQLARDNALGTKLSVTCNTQSSLVLGAPYVSARVAATSFTITLDIAPTTNPMCISYSIVN